MLPSFAVDDHILTFNWMKPKIGQAAIFKKNDQYYLKRVLKISSGQMVVGGDNRQESSKNEKVLISQIVGRVIYKY